MALAQTWEGGVQMNVFLLMVTPGVSGRLLSLLPPWHEQCHLQNTHGIYENETEFLYLLHIWSADFENVVTILHFLNP